MFKKVCVSIAPLLLVSALPVMAEERAPYNCDFNPSCEVAPGVYGAMASPVMSKFNLSIGGYLKLDYAHNTNASGPTTSPAGAAALPARSRESESIFTAKQSRFWLRVAGPTFLGAKTGALLEADFYGGNSTANEFANMRMRHAYGSLDWSTTQVLFGQFWDVFGPAAADTIDFRQGGDTGAPNSPRVPQIRLTQRVDFNKDNSLKFVLAVQNPVQNNATVNPVNSGGDNAFPSAAGNAGTSMVNVAGQAIYSSKILGVSPGFMGLGQAPLQLGLFGLYGNEKVNIGATTNSEHVNVWGYGVYGFVPVIKSSDGKSRAMTLSLETQAYMSRGMNVQNAVSQATVGDPGSRQGAKGFGYYGQLKFYPTQNLGVTGGYMRRSAMSTEEYRDTVAATNFQHYNELTYGNLTYDLNAAVRVATEYEHHVTKYDNNVPGARDSRGQNNVFRVAAYYFF